MAFASDIRAARERCGLTLAAAAGVLGIGLSTLKAWESGDPKRVPLEVAQEGALARLAKHKPKRP